MLDSIYISHGHYQLLLSTGLTFADDFLSQNLPSYGPSPLPPSVPFGSRTGSHHFDGIPAPEFNHFDDFREICYPRGAPTLQVPRGLTMPNLPNDEQLKNEYMPGEGSGPKINIDGDNINYETPVVGEGRCHFSTNATVGMAVGCVVVGSASVTTGTVTVTATVTYGFSGPGLVVAVGFANPLIPVALAGAVVLGGAIATAFSMFKPDNEEKKSS
jgi:hypothetical protein